MSFFKFNKFTLVHFIVLTIIVMIIVIAIIISVSSLKNKSTGNTISISSSENNNTSSQAKSSSSSKSSSIISQSKSSSSSKISNITSQANVSSVKSNSEKSSVASSNSQKSDIEFIGRYSKTASGSYLLSWSGSGLITSFIGTELYATFNIKSINDDDYIDISIDNGKPRLLKIDSKTDIYTITSGLSNSLHKVEIVKRTEATAGILEFVGFDYKGGKAVKNVDISSRKIEFIGDSITCGYGNEVKDGPNGYLTIQENANKSYAIITSRNLNAKWSIVARSGIGIVQDCLGNKDGNMISYYQKPNLTLPSNNWDFKYFDADVVVINLGTNDFASSVQSDTFKQKYKDLIKLIKEKYTSPQIICCCGPMHFQYDAAVLEIVSELKAEGDMKISYFKFDAIKIGSEGLGADAHPSYLTHTSMASKLSTFIKEKMSW